MLTLTEIMDKLGGNIHMAQQVKDLVASKRKPTKPKACGHCGGRAHAFPAEGGYVVAWYKFNCPKPQSGCHKTRQGAINEWNEEIV